MIVFLFLIGTINGFAQIVAIENWKENIVHSHLDNYLTIIVEGTPCDQIVLRTNNGKIKSITKSQYRFIPDEIGVREFKTQIGVHEPIEGFDISGHFPAKKYRLQVLRNGKLIGEIRNKRRSRIRSNSSGNKFKVIL